MPKNLTPKLRLFLKCYLDPANPRTFGNATASARAAGYRCRTPASFENMGQNNLRRLAPQIEQWLDENALSTARLKELLAEGLQAKETRFFAHQGEIVTERDVIPWEIRRKYLEMALKVRGMYAPEKHEFTGQAGGPIDLTSLVMGLSDEPGNEN